MTDLFTKLCDWPQYNDTWGDSICRPITFNHASVKAAVRNWSPLSFLLTTDVVWSGPGIIHITQKSERLQCAEVCVATAYVSALPRGWIVSALYRKRPYDDRVIHIANSNMSALEAMARAVSFDAWVRKSKLELRKSKLEFQSV